MDRRGFLGGLIGAALSTVAASMLYDKERALWLPGTKAFSFPSESNAPKIVPAGAWIAIRLDKTEVIPDVLFPGRYLLQSEWQAVEDPSVRGKYIHSFIDPHPFADAQAKVFFEKRRQIIK